MVVKKSSVKPEARADTSTPDLQARADAGAAEVGVPPYSEPEPTSYTYIGGLDAVVAVVDGTAYDFRRGDPVHFGQPQPALDDHPDFERVEAGA